MYIFQPDRFLLDKQAKRFSKYITGKTLDVGAGQFDRYGKYFETKDVIKMDIAEGPNVDVVGSADKIPLGEDSLDSIVCTQVFEHLKNPFGAAVEFFRVLRSGGHVLLTVPQTNELHEEPNDYFRYTKYGIEEVFRAAGFSTIEIDQRGGYYAMLAQLRVRHLIDKYNLYKRPILGKVANKIFGWYGRFMIWRDGVDVGATNKKHAIGWCFVFKK